MKNISLPRFLTVTASVCALMLLTGCFETKDEFTINPDGSGKVVHESSFQQVNLGNQEEATEDSLKEAIGKVITESKGIEAWRDVSFKRLDDGRLFFKGTAYFTNLNTLDIPNQTMLEFDWQKSDGGAVLTETIFSWPGVGKWLIESISRRDYPALQGGVMLISSIVIVVNLLVDLTYGLINPRIRHA